MVTNRFDPVEGTPYAMCSDCKFVATSRAESDAHLSETTPEGGYSHTMRVTNPTREERVRRGIDRILEEALDDFVSDVEDLIESGDATEEEVDPIVNRIGGDFAAAWEARNDG